jgi:hypothetical protein
MFFKVLQPSVSRYFKVVRWNITAHFLEFNTIANTQHMMVGNFSKITSDLKI